MPKLQDMKCRTGFVKIIDRAAQRGPGSNDKKRRDGKAWIEKITGLECTMAMQNDVIR